MIVDLESLKVFLDIDITDDSQDDALNTILQPLDTFTKEFCRRDFDSTTYTNQLYDGNGEKSLLLNHYPIISVARLSTSRVNAIKIKNSSSDATNATVSVDSDSVDLVVSGGTNEDSTSLAFSTYTTMTTLVAAIIAVGKGWTSELIDGDYGSLLSTDLIACSGKYCGARAASTATWKYLEMGDTPISDFEIYDDRGEIWRSGGFPAGRQNIVISYTAGYAAADMPYDLKLAIHAAAKYLYQKRNEDGFGLTNFSTGHLSVKYVELLPPETLEILGRYKRMIV